MWQNFGGDQVPRFYIIFYGGVLGSVVGPVIQANGRLTFEDDLRSGGLLYSISIKTSVRTELVNSMVTPGETGDD